MVTGETHQGTQRMDAPRPRWLERLVGETRQTILELLQRSDQTVQELADGIGISANAVRGHLSALERDGLVMKREARRDTGGKPAMLYALSQEGDELFPKAYATVLLALLEVLDDRIGPNQVKEALSEVGARAARPARGSPEERVRAAAEVLESLGGTVEVRRENGTWRIQGFSCPLSSVIDQDARVCGLAETLVQRTTGGAVTEQCERECRARCSFRISFPARAGTTG